MSIGLIVTQACVFCLLSLSAGLLVMPSSALKSGLASVFGLCAGLGAALLAAMMSAGSALGMPKAAILGLAVALCAAGLARSVWLQVGLVRGWRRMVPCALGLLVLLHPGIVLALTMPPVIIDAVACWWPKMDEATRGIFPQIARYVPDTHPFYPRGSAWLGVLAAWGGEVDGRWCRIIPVLFWWWTLLAVAESAMLFGRPLAGLACAAVLALIPEISGYFHAGYVDALISFCILLASVGVTLGVRDQSWLSATAVAGVGAAAFKEEGTAILALIVGLLLLTYIRRRRVGWELVLIVAILALTLPWWSLRSTHNLGYASLILPLLVRPLLFVERCGVTMKELLDTLWFHSPSAFDRGTPNFASWFTLIAIILICARYRWRILNSGVALLLAGLYFLVYVATTESSVRWIVSLSLGRLLWQILPVLLLSAFLALFNDEKCSLRERWIGRSSEELT
jgi:hypothetical protein